MKSSFQSRCIFLCSTLVVGLSVLSARLVQIQLVDRKRYAERVRDERHSTEILPAPRGMIVDRHEEPLARTIPVSSVFVDKNHLKDPTLVAYGLAYQAASSEREWAVMDAADRRRRISQLRREILKRDTTEAILSKYLAYVVGELARPLGMRRQELWNALSEVRTYKGKEISTYTVAKDLPQDVVEHLREIIDEKWIEGFGFENSITRWYTAPDLAAHVIGFTGEVAREDDAGKVHTSVVGKFGVEASMEEFLAGRDGFREHYRDARGLVVPGNSASLKPPRAGLNVKLTLDMGIQAIVEDELDKGLAEFISERGAVVLMDPKTGEVLAMASRPDFNSNRKEKIAENSFNYAIQTVYEPGSTIKVVAAAGALNEGLVHPQTMINCHNGYYRSGAVHLRDEHPAGTLTFEGVLQKSNNIGTYSLGRQLGSGRFYDYLHRFGFGKKSGIQLSGESSGMARDTGNEVDFSRACFGYATNVTPLQLACAYSAIASDGKLRKPHIVKALIANDGTVVEDYQPEVVHEVLKAPAAAKMRAALEKVVLKGGTATQAAVDGFRVAGKTGTVQKHNPKGGYYQSKHIVSFCGMMPAQDPAFVCIVVIDDPQTTAVNIFGGSIAGPIFSRIATRVAAHLNLQPTEVLAKAK